MHPTYPYSHTLSSQTDTFTIAQISDLHLSNHEPAYFDNFLAVLALARCHNPDLLLLTGDLVNDGEADVYDWLFDVLQCTQIPFLCLAGNHDVTQEIGHELPFHERSFLPIPADERLIDTHRLVVELGGSSWQILLLNSAVNGQIYGHLNADTLSFLTQHLAQNPPQNTLIALHHHPAPVGSAWIDGHILQNRDEFWQTLAHFDQNLHIICGHVHQAHTITVNNHTLYTCPATSRQFTPHQDEFGVDNMSSGFRLVQLQNNTLKTAVYRI